MTDTPDFSPSTPQNPTDGDQLTRFFDWIRSSGITRGSERWFAGVCGGIARRTGLDPLIVRGIAVVVAVLGGPALFAYAVGWALLPNEQGRIHAEDALRGRFEPAMVAIAALLVFTIAPFSRGFWWEGPPVAWGMPDWLATTFTVGWSLAVAAGIVWLVVFLLRRMPAPRGPGQPWGGPRAGGGTGAGGGASGSTGGAGAAGGGTSGTADSTTGAPATTSTQSTAAFVAAPGTASFTAAPGGTTGSVTGPPSPAAATATTASPVADPAIPPYSAWDALQDQKRDRHDHHRDRQSERKSWHTNRHPGAGFTAIVVGLALTAGAIAAGFLSAGGWSGNALVVGLAFALGVLALGVIVSGIRGRDSGAMGGFAFLTALALVVLGVFPHGTQFTPFGSPTWQVESSDSVPGYALLAGEATVDLGSLDDTRNSGARTIDVWVGAGVTELILPTSAPVRVEAHALVGGVDYGSNRTADERNGMFFEDSRTFNSGTSRAIPVVRVWSLVGQVTIADDNN